MLLPYPATCLSHRFASCFFFLDARPRRVWQVLQRLTDTRPSLGQWGMGIRPASADDGDGSEVDSGDDEGATLHGVGCVCVSLASFTCIRRPFVKLPWPCLPRESLVVGVVIGLRYSNIWCRRWYWLCV